MVFMGMLPQLHITEMNDSNFSNFTDGKTEAGSAGC
jgi:hypothetical protein